ncbi:MAG: CBS domain-containing protein [Anaerolineales bacterium]|nr:CBS domain-containing protein [Anaerolineales bacterium]MDW8447759.1 CBS domain-containing protein [Anaerolineales bacterium]
MNTVKALLESIGKRPHHSVAANATVLDALRVMAEANVGAVMVIEDDKVVGIFTERDYARKGELQGRCAKDTPIREVMVQKMVTVTPETTVDQCMALMKQFHIRHLPVVENNQMVGLISLRDVMEAAIRSRESEIRGLENYILSSGFQG